LKMRHERCSCANAGAIGHCSFSGWNTIAFCLTLRKLARGFCCVSGGRLDSSIGVVLESLTGRIAKNITVLAGKNLGIHPNQLFRRQKGPAHKASR
jgi:hypothetical protein